MIDTPSVEVASDAVETALVTIEVPGDAAPGEHFAVVWAEARSGGTVDGGLTTVTRVGIRVYLSVGAGAAPAADFSVDSLTAARTEDGLPTVVAQVTNTGGRALDIHGTLELLDGPGGLSAGPFAATLGTTIGVGDTEKVSVVLDAQVPAGPWRAVLTLGSGLLERSTEATITFPETGSAAPVVPSVPTWPWLIVAGALILIAVIVLVWQGRKRR